MIYYITNQLSTDYEIKTIDQCIEYFKDIDEVQVDTETENFFDHKAKILLLQLGTYEDQWVIDFQSLDAKDRLKLNSILVSDKIKLLHNAKFDIKFIWRHGLDINNVYDTMLAERLINAGNERPKGYYSLYSLGKRYCNIELDKSVRGEIKGYGITSKVINYAAEDVKYLSKIKADQMKILKGYNMANDDCQDIYTVLGLENNAVLAFASMEYNGIKLDTAKWAVIEQELKIKVEDLKNELNNIVCSTPELSKYCYTYIDLFTAAYNTTKINWASPVQKLEILQKLVPNIEDTSERTLQKYKKNYPIMGKMLEYSKMNKLYTAFAKKMPDYINPVTGRIHTEFWQILDTGRVSSAEPNMQQIPSRTEIGGRMRSCFVAEQGNKMVGGDYSGCELRIIAEFSQDPVWVNSFLEGKDLHSELCVMTFDIPMSDVKKNTPFKPDIKYRDVQKTLNFG